VLKRFRIPIVAALALAIVAFGGAPSGPSTAEAQPQPALSVLSSYQANAAFDATGAEIVVYESGRMYVVNGDRKVIELVDISDPSNPVFLADISITPWGGDVTSAAIHKGLLVAAVPAVVKTDPGKAVFFDQDGNFIRAIEVGALPDMVTFTPNGAWVLVANEGEPNDDYSVDPEGSITIIQTSAVKSGHFNGNAVRHVTFEAFNEGNSRHHELPEDIRIFGPGATVAQDIEPEYIAVSHDNRKAYVSLQENNAVAVIDIQRGVVDRIWALGFKDHSLPGNGFDASDRYPNQVNPQINIANWPVLGMYQPDSLATYRVRGQNYVVTANEGDAREWLGNPGYVEAQRLRALTDPGGGTPLCPDVFPNAASLRDNANLGRLTVTSANGLRTEGAHSPCYEEIYAFGARSFSIWSDDGAQVYDSGDDFERITAEAYPEFFNSNHRENSLKTRSDDKGPEPEGVVLAEVKGRWYAFIGLERIGGVMVYDITNPHEPVFIQYVNNRDFSQVPTGPDTGAEGLFFVDAKDSPTQTPLLLVANEVSGTVTIFEFD